jgi:signal transduction histidine kinase
MLSIRNISIRNKLIWMQVITSVLVLGLCFAAFVITDIKGYKGREVNHDISIAQVIGANTISAIQFLDNDAANKTLSELQKVQEDIINATIFDKNGNVFADYNKPGNAPCKFYPPFADRYIFKGDLLYVYKNIIKSNELFGTVCLQVELSQLEQIKAEKFKMAAVLLVIGILLAFLLAIINQQYISKPLLSLVNTMKVVRENENYAMQVPIEGKDEIAKLSLEFNSLMEQVIFSHQKKDEFIGIASHELKTPLTSAKGFLELLNNNDALDPQTKLFVQKALGSTNKLQDLIYDLLDVSKIQAGQLQLDIKEFDIDKLIDECIHEVQISTSAHNIIKEGGMVNSVIFADRNRIEQVVLNLLSNAVKYSPKGGRIIVHASRTNSKIIVSVKDFGIGLPMSELEKIFDRFYRSKQKESGAAGFGLGLYICAQIIKRHNGKIWVESEAGNGSTFYFELPIKAELVVVI